MMNCHTCLDCFHSPFSLSNLITLLIIVVLIKGFFDKNIWLVGAALVGLFLF